MRTLACLLLVACGGNKPAPENPPVASSMLDCEKVAGHVATTVVASRPRAGATQATIQEMVTTRCKADAWSDETKQCLHAIKSMQEGRACATKMTDEQRTAIRTAAQALRKDATPPATPDDDQSDWIKHVVEEPAK